VGADSVNFVDQIFHTDDVVFAKGVADDAVVGQRNALLVHFTVTTFVHHFGDGLDIGGTVSDVWFHASKHDHGGLVDLQEDGVVDLQKTEQLQDLGGLGGHTVDTTDADNQQHLGFSGHVKLVVVLGLTLVSDQVLFLVSVFLHISFGAFESDLAGGFFGLGAGNSGSDLLSLNGFDGFTLLQYCFGDGCAKNKTFQDK